MLLCIDALLWLALQAEQHAEELITECKAECKPVEVRCSANQLLVLAL